MSEEKKVHWITLQALVRKAGPKGISKFQMADKLKVGVNDQNFVDALIILDRQPSISKALGVDKEHNDAVTAFYSPRRDHRRVEARKPDEAEEEAPRASKAKAGTVASRAQKRIDEIADLAKSGEYGEIPRVTKKKKKGKISYGTTT